MKGTGWSHDSTAHFWLSQAYRQHWQELKNTLSLSNSWMTSTGEWPAQTADGKWVEQVGAQTGKLDCLKFCGHFDAFGMTPSSSVECEAKFKLLTGEEQILLCQLLFLVSQDFFSQPSQGVCVDEKESRDTFMCTQLPVVFVNNWTNCTYPAASLDFIQLQATQTKDGTTPLLKAEIISSHSAWGRGKQKHWFLQLLEQYEKEKRVRQQQCVPALPSQKGCVSPVT